MIRTHRRGLVVALTVLALGACVDSPASLAAEADAGDPLALTFDELARQAAASGDMNRAEGFTYAAISARNGVAPTRLDVINGTALETYEAFVSAISWQLPAASTIRGWIGGMDSPSIRAARNTSIERCARSVPLTSMMRAPATPRSRTGTTPQALVCASGVS